MSSIHDRRTRAYDSHDDGAGQQLTQPPVHHRRRPASATPYRDTIRSTSAAIIAAGCRDDADQATLF
jgi:hypothetical protein